MKKLIVVIAGCKCSGKNTLANQLAAQRLKKTHSGKDWWVDPGDGMLYNSRELHAKPMSLDPGTQSESVIALHGVRTMAFATLLKEFCITVLGLNRSWVYGSDRDKMNNSLIKWEGMPPDVRRKAAGFVWSKPWTWLKIKKGWMTYREVLQYFATEVVRRLKSDAWAVAAYRAAIECPESVVFLTDARFPSELEIPHKVGAGKFFPVHKDVVIKTIRLKRRPKNDNHVSEHALDDYNESLFDAVLPEDVSFNGQAMLMEQKFERWLEEAGLRIK